MKNMVGYGAKELTSREYSAAGLMSGVATRCLVQPLDVLKIRFQVQQEPTFGKTRGRYHGFVQACLRIYKEEGLSAFWKGHVPAQGLSAVYGIVQFTTFEILTEEALQFPLANENRRVTDIVCGALAGCTAMSFAMPLDIIRTRLVVQDQRKIYNGTLHAVRMIWISDGFRGFFRGITPSLLQIAPYTGLQFSLYNAFSVAWERLPKFMGSAGPLCCGALAGVASKTAIYPLDVVRHRLQVRGFHNFHEVPWHSVCSTIIHIIRDESFTGLFKGLWPSQLKAACSSGFAFMFYEISLEVLRGLR